MTRLKTFSVRLNPSDMDLVKRKLKEISESDPEITTNREALLFLIKDVEAPVIVRSEDLSARDINASCDLNFLQRIIDPKDGLSKWFCLRGSRPDRRSKPILMGDGKDESTILKLCQACRDGWVWTQQRELSADKIQAIKSFGESEIEAHLFICNNPDSHYVQITPDPKSDFLCLKTNNRQSIKKKCVLESCDYLIHQILKVVIKDTPQYEELQKQLEEKKQ